MAAMTTLQLIALLQSRPDIVEALCEKADSNPEIAELLRQLRSMTVLP